MARATQLFDQHGSWQVIMSAGIYLAVTRRCGKIRRHVPSDAFQPSNMSLIDLVRRSSICMSYKLHEMAYVVRSLHNGVVQALRDAGNHYNELNLRLRGRHTGGKYSGRRIKICFDDR